MSRPNVRAAGAALAASVLLCLLQAARAYSILPGRVASHFGPSGLPDGWAPKGGFLALFAGLALFLPAALLAALRSIRAAPGSRINLPHKEYWLAPERREETMAAIGAYLLWFGAATNLLMLDVFRQALRVNLGLAPGLEHPLVSVSAYLVFTAAWLAFFAARFSRKAA